MVFGYSTDRSITGYESKKTLNNHTSFQMIVLNEYVYLCLSEKGIDMQFTTAIL